MLQLRGIHRSARRTSVAPELVVSVYRGYHDVCDLVHWLRLAFRSSGGPRAIYISGHGRGRFLDVSLRPTAGRDGADSGLTASATSGRRSAPARTVSPLRHRLQKGASRSSVANACVSWLQGDPARLLRDRKGHGRLA